MSNLNDPLEETADGVHAVRIAERARAEHLGASLYDLQPGEEMVFHYHVQREELLIVLGGGSASGAPPAGRNFRKARSSRSSNEMPRTASTSITRRRNTPVVVRYVRRRSCVSITLS
jgi:hypothetical protein